MLIRNIYIMAMMAHRLNTWGQFQIVMRWRTFLIRHKMMHTSLMVMEMGNCVFITVLRGQHVQVVVRSLPGLRAQTIVQGLKIRIRP